MRNRFSFSCFITQLHDKRIILQSYVLQLFTLIFFYSYCLTLAWSHKNSHFMVVITWKVIFCKLLSVFFSHKLTFCSICVAGLHHLFIFPTYDWFYQQLCFIAAFWKSMKWSTLVKSHMSAQNVKRHSHKRHIWKHMNLFLLAKSHMAVQNVTRHSHNRAL